MIAATKPGLRIKVESRRLVHEPGDWAKAIGQLDSNSGIYCESLHGVPGLHPRFAWVVRDVALRLRIHANSVRIDAVGPSASTILNHAAMAELVEITDGGQGCARLRPAHREDSSAEDFARSGDSIDLPSRRHPVARWLRAFLSVFDADDAFGLFGAFKFEAHKLNGLWNADDPDLMGVLLMPESLLIQQVGGPVQGLRFEFPAEVQVTGASGPDASGPDASAPDARRASRVPDSSLGIGSGRATAREDDHPHGGHAAVVARGLNALANPSLVSLTLSQSFRRPWSGSAVQAFERLRSVNPAPVTFLAHLLQNEWLFGASPDLQLMVRGRSVQSFPVCGTVRRTVGPIGHAQALKSLINESVDEAALAICSDALKNDLTPLCTPGTLRLTARRAPLSLATLVHAVDALEGELLAGCDGLDAVLATTAPAMVTGTPRALALAEIAQLESSARAWYGGLVVRIGCRGDAEAGTILRTAWLHDGIAEVRTGGDLVVGSDPVREDEETRLKAISLWRALGLQATPGLAQPVAADWTADSGSLRLQPDRRSRVRANRLIWQSETDPFRESLNELLGSAELSCETNAAEVLVLSGADPVLLEQTRNSHAGILTLAIGQAGTWLLEREADWFAATEPIQNGRLLWVGRSADGSDRWPSAFYAGAYGKRLRADEAETLPARNGWQCVQSASAGEWVSAINVKKRTVVICFRPDSILSEIGARQTLRVAIDWLRTLNTDRHAS